MNFVCVMCASSSKAFILYDLFTMTKIQRFNGKLKKFFTFQLLNNNLAAFLKYEI